MTLNNNQNIDIDDVYLFNIGEAQQAYATFGCHYIKDANAHRFIVWAPNAISVSVIGDFNNWDINAAPMKKHETGVFYTWISGLKNGDAYKYYIVGFDGKVRYKADPFAFHAEVRPKTASKIWDLGGYIWHDNPYFEQLNKKNFLNSPMCIYEMHIGSWRIKEGYHFPNMRETADELAAYLIEMGFTHVELMPVNEYPLDTSWGYQVTGYYAVTARYGTPQDLMYFVDTMHQNGIGVIIDWVPAHFPKDDHGLRQFDGTCLYEHQNPMQADHPQWGTLIFNYGRPEVISFLVSSAMMFFDVYHVDGIRVDAVTSMLYLNYARNKGEYIPNKWGGDIDLDAVEFLKKLNATILTRHPKAITIAEESTSYPLITRPPYDGGLGFSFKWNMGYMHDTLKYMSMNPYFRQFHHNKMTFSMSYSFSENYILPYSHDEVVHGKKSMLDKMYGDYDQKFASLKTLYGFQYSHPGKKLMFMGSEFGQFIEWDYQKELDWFLLGYPRHKNIQDFVKALNRFYTDNEALFMIDDGWEGFTWLNVNEAEKSALGFMRTSGGSKPQHIICVFNFTPALYETFRFGLPQKGSLKEVLNSDHVDFGGQGLLNTSLIHSKKEEYAGFMHCAEIILPPLSAVFFNFEPEKNAMQGGHKNDE